MLFTKLLVTILATASLAPLAPQPEPGAKPPPPALKKDSYLPEGVRVVRNLTYAQVGEKKLLLDVYLPSSDQGALLGALEPFEGRPIEEITISGLVTVERRLVDSQIKSSKAGRKLSHEEVQQDTERLNRLGRFSKIDVTAHEAAGSSVRLNFEFVEAPGEQGAAALVNGAPPRPVIIWIHGGAWEGGNKDDCPARFLVLKGYSVVSINYRLTDVAPFPAQIHDCKAAVRWVRGNAKEHNFDADHIGVWGASAGGHLVALLGTSAGVKELEGDVGDYDELSSRVQAVCDWFGPTDLVTLCRDFVEKQKKSGALDPADSKPPTPSIFKKFLGGELDDKLDLCKSANPIVYVDKSDAPVLIMHGDKDELVPLSQSEELVEAMKKAGVPIELEVIKGAGHGFWSQEIVDKLVKFFDGSLKKTN
jgi:acetyl esterase/lipase